LTFVGNSEVSITDASEINQGNAVPEEALIYELNVHVIHIRTIGLRCCRRWNDVKYA
jgi:hypothetical protein